MLDNDLSIAELARQTKMQYKIIADYIKELSTPNLYNAIKLASFFNCSLDFITGLSNEENFSKYSTPKFNFFENYQKEIAEFVSNHNLPEFNFYTAYYYNETASLDFITTSENEELYTFFNTFVNTYNLKKFYQKYNFYYDIFYHYKMN